jgi:hypothetical protein
MLPQAEAAYLAALTSARHDADHRLILESLAQMLKRQNRRHEAANYWESLAALSPYSPKPRLELAIYHEWTTGNIPYAIEWTERAQQVVSNWPLSPAQRSELAEIEHRLSRLSSKL